MSNNPLLPRPQANIVDAGGRPTTQFHEFLRRLSDGASLAEILARLEALEQGLGGTPSIQGPLSVRVQGTLAGGVVQVTLRGDEQSPGETYYYGTNGAGQNGWHAVADAVEGATDELTKVVAGDGVTTFGLADVTPVAGGLLQKYGFDAKGRRSEQEAATTDDLPEGSTNLYFTDDRAEAAAMGPSNAALSAAMVYTDVVAATKVDLNSPPDDSLVLRGDNTWGNNVSGDFGFGTVTINYSGAAFGRVITQWSATTCAYELASAQPTVPGLVGTVIATSTANNANYVRLAEMRMYIAGGSTAGQYGGGLGFLTRERDLTGAPQLRLGLTDEGNLHLGTGNVPTVFGNSYGGGKGVSRVVNAGTAPTTNPTGAGLFWSANGGGFWRSDTGHVTNFAPKNAPAVTGSRGGNAALASLLTALAGLGLIADSTTP